MPPLASFILVCALLVLAFWLGWEFSRRNTRSILDAQRKLHEDTLHRVQPNYRPTGCTGAPGVPISKPEPRRFEVPSDRTALIAELFDSAWKVPESMLYPKDLWDEIGKMFPETATGFWTIQRHGDEKPIHYERWNAGDHNGALCRYPGKPLSFSIVEVLP
jgi:hypothetical protein